MKKNKKEILTKISHIICFIKNNDYQNYYINNRNNLNNSEIVLDAYKLVSIYEEYYNRVLNDELILDIRNFNIRFEHYDEKTPLFTIENMFKIKAYVSEIIYADLKLMELLGGDNDEN